MEEQFLIQTVLMANTYDFLRTFFPSHLAQDLLFLADTYKDDRARLLSQLKTSLRPRAERHVWAKVPPLVMVMYNGWADFEDRREFQSISIYEAKYGADEKGLYLTEAPQLLTEDINSYLHHLRKTEF